MRLIQLLSILILNFVLAKTAFGLEQKYLSHSQSDNALTIQTDKGQVKLTFYNAETVEAFYQPAGLKQLPSFSIAELPINTKVRLKSSKSQLDFSSSELQIIVEKSPLRIRYLKNGLNVLSEEQGLIVENGQRGFRFALSYDEKLMGTGERVLGMNRRGQKLPLYNKASYGYNGKTEQMYFSLPMILSSNKYLLLFDNSANGSADLGKTEKNILEFSAVDGRTSYVLITGESKIGRAHV